MNTVTDVAAHIKQIWSSSAFMNLLKIEIDEIHCGGATVKMPIDFDIHTNHWLGVHGGALAALADAVMGITGASVGEVVQTLSFNINFILNSCRITQVIFLFNVPFFIKLINQRHTCRYINSNDFFIRKAIKNFYQSPE